MRTSFFVLAGLVQFTAQQEQGNNAFGLELKPSYGTIAIAYPNGTTTALARINGTLDYQETMQRLSQREAQHPAPPYHDAQERLADVPRQLFRSARKRAGLPASPDVGAIGLMVKELKEAAEDILKFHISKAAISLPMFVAMYEEDILDACYYADPYFKYLRIMPYSYSLTYGDAATLAGYGFSVCDNIYYPELCDAGYNKYDTRYLIVEYTETHLGAYNTDAHGKNGAYRLWGMYYFDFFLGSNRKNQNPEMYWYNVRKLILKVLVSSSYDPPCKIIFTGESAHNRDFRIAAEEILKEWYKNKPNPKFLDEDPEFIQQRGTAEFARREPYMKTFGTDDEFFRSQDLRSQHILP